MAKKGHARRDLLPEKSWPAWAHGALDVELEFLHHPLFGHVPYHVARYLHNGQTTRRAEPDPSFAPPLPKGAVRGDVLAQAFCGMCHTPRYFYVDEERGCVQCERRFVFGAREQKYWYETLKFTFDSHAIRCVDCRKKRRSEVALQGALELATAAVDARPDDAPAHLALAEAIVALTERTRRGSLAKAIAAARRARKLAHELHEALYWEARAHELAGREARSLAAFGAFVEAAAHTKRCSSLVADAKQRSARLATPAQTDRGA